MAHLEERVAFLEGKVGEHSHMLDGIRDAIVHLDARIDRRFESIDRRFTSIDNRFTLIEQRMTTLERKIDERTDALDTKISRQFVWLVGMQVTTLAAVVAAFATMMAALIGR